jgi:D-psicose/D-tagatose/L-ribulose 3-epimerase
MFFKQNRFKYSYMIIFKEEVVMMTNKIGMHCGYFRGTDLEFDIYGMLDVASNAGAQVIELIPALFLDLTKDERKEYRKAMEDKGICLSICGGMSAKTDISSDDPDVRKNGLEFAKRVMQAGMELGSNVWAGILYAYWPGRISSVENLLDKPRIREVSINEMKKMVKIAEDTDITLGFEVVNRFEHFIMNTAAEGIFYAEQVNHPKAKLLLDAYHMNIEEDSFEKAILMTLEKDLLGHYHVGESNRRMPGTGDTHIPWQEILKALYKGGYQGYITMEPFVLTNIPNALSVGLWRDLSGGASLDKLIADVKVGVDFMKEQMKRASQ